MGAILAELEKDFLAHGPPAVVAMRKKSPARYMEALLSLMPKEYDLGEKTANPFLAFLAAIDAGKVPLPPNPHKKPDSQEGEQSR
jgi:hypothetical protein